MNDHAHREDFSKARKLVVFTFLEETFVIVRDRSRGKPFGTTHFQLLHAGEPMAGIDAETTDANAAARIYLAKLQKCFGTDREDMLSNIASLKARNVERRRHDTTIYGRA